MSAAWRDGWWMAEGVRHCPSPNFNARPPDARMDLAVIHSISLPPGVWGGGEIERLFTNRLDWTAHPYFEQIRGLQVSSHFVIDRQGVPTQYVSVLDRAWHAGASSWRGRAQCNDYAIGIELEGLEGGCFEPVQMDRLVTLLQALAQRWGVQEVAGHEHIAPGRKGDPGPGFDWAALVAALHWPDGQFACVEAPRIPEA